MLTHATTNRPAEIVLRGARLLDPAQGLDTVADISIRQGRIAEIGEGVAASPGQREIDATGLVITPGFVDPHVHVRVPGADHVESIATGTAAAARGGYCAIVSMPNTNPVIDSPELLASLHRDAACEAVVPIGFAAAISVGQEGDCLSEMCELADAGAMLFTDDGKPVTSPSLLRRALQYQKVAGLPLALHEEDPDLSGPGVMHEGATSTRMGLHGIPSLSEWAMVARDVRIAAAEGGQIHLQHLSCAESVEEVAWAKARGARVTAEVTPHHLLLTDELVATCDTNLKMNPPLRSAADRDALVEALADGTIDMVATDHAPHWHERKELPFEQAPFGVTGLETAFATIYTGLVATGRLTLERLVDALSTKPAQLLQIAEPRIEVGAPANLAVLDLDATWTVGEQPFASAAGNSAFLDRTLAGQVVMTLAAGAVAWDAASQGAGVANRELAGVSA